MVFGAGWAGSDSRSTHVGERRAAVRGAGGGRAPTLHRAETDEQAGVAELAQSGLQAALECADHLVEHRLERGLDLLVEALEERGTHDLEVTEVEPPSVQSQRPCRGEALAVPHRGDH